MDLSKLKELIELMNRHQLEELEVEEDGFRVRLSKQGERVREVVTVPTAIAGAPVPAMGDPGG
ncbi:MAG: acetyl-CoA carboxylase, biotin carboxyl carrier protein, partial [Planctomycetota bacterium]